MNLRKKNEQKACQTGCLSKFQQNLVKNSIFIKKLKKTQKNKKKPKKNLTA